MNLTWSRLLELGCRWWWLLVVAPLVAGLTTLTLGTRQDPTYTAEAQIMIDPGQGQEALDYGVVQAIQYQAETYERLIELDLVLVPVVRDLGLPYGVEMLKDQVSGSAVHGTQLFVVTASDRDPERAAAVANAVTSRFLAYIEGLAVQARTPVRGEVDRQIDETRRRIADTVGRVQELEQGPEAFDPIAQPELVSLNADIEQLQGSLRQLQETANRMDIDAAAARARAVVAAEASTPTSPSDRRIGLLSLLAASSGLMFSAGLLLLFESVADLRSRRVDKFAFAD